MSKVKTQSTELTTSEDQQSTAMREHNASTYSAMMKAEIESAMTVAVRYGRNEDAAYGAICKATDRATFREKCIYRFPRGDSEIIGPSVVLAREFARAWGHIRYGFEVISDGDEQMQIRGFAWDLVTGARASQDACFRKLIYRKNRGWIKPDERDLRELVNKHGSIAERNCLLKLLPGDMVEDVMTLAAKKELNNVTNDLDVSRRKLIAAFASLNIDVTAIEAFLRHPIASLSPIEVVELRQIFISIRDGNSSWAEYQMKTNGDATPAATPAKKGSASIDDLIKPTETVHLGTPAATTPEVVLSARAREHGTSLVECGSLEAIDVVTTAILQDRELTESDFSELLELAETRRRNLGKLF